MHTAVMVLGFKSPYLTSISAPWSFFRSSFSFRTPIQNYNYYSPPSVVVAPNPYMVSPEVDTYQNTSTARAMNAASNVGNDIWETIVGLLFIVAIGYLYLSLGGGRDSRW